MQNNILPSSPTTLIENIKIRDLRAFAACNFFLVILGCLAILYAPTPHSVTISNDYPSSPAVNIFSRAPIKTLQAVAGLPRAGIITWRGALRTTRHCLYSDLDPPVHNLWVWGQTFMCLKAAQMHRGRRLDLIQTLAEHRTYKILSIPKKFWV